MAISGINSDQNITIINSQNTANQEQSGQTQTTNEEETQQTLYWIGSEIVSKAVFDQYDTNKDGIISESEKAAYEKAMNRNSNGSFDITA